MVNLTNRPISSNETNTRWEWRRVSMKYWIKIMSVTEQFQIIYDDHILTILLVHYTDKCSW